MKAAAPRQHELRDADDAHRIRGHDGPSQLPLARVDVETMHGHWQLAELAHIHPPPVFAPLDRNLSGLRARKERGLSSVDRIETGTIVTRSKRDDAPVRGHGSAHHDGILM
jgi:hypothetical protein